MPVPDVSGRTIDELVSLENRVAVITGAAQGIGYAIAERFAEAGADLVIGDIDEDAVGKAVVRLDNRHDRMITGVTVDVRNESAVTHLASHTVTEFGQIDVWVNNAGAYPITPVMEVERRQWAETLDVNLTGTFLGAREAARRMVDAGHGGVIINVSSVAAYRASPVGGAEYVAAKHGVDGLTKALAVQLGQYGIRVLALAPATTETPGIQRSRQEVAALGLEAVDAHRVTPLGRGGVPDDVARVALFCAADLSMLMTGTTLLIDGGSMAVL